MHHRVVAFFWASLVARIPSDACAGAFSLPEPIPLTMPSSLEHDVLMCQSEADTRLYRIKSSCRKGNTSVPRSRVYTSYVRRCAREKIAVLNPASFGKLVRVLYPGLRTRRLGVRGESKYHYVDFELELIDDDVEEDIERLSVAARSAPSFAESMNFR